MSVVSFALAVVFIIRLTTSDVKFAEKALGQQKLLDSSLPSVNVGAGASISAQRSDNSDYDASQSLSKSQSMSSEEFSRVVFTRTK